jgi:predicted metal-binding membrane protein
MQLDTILEQTLKRDRWVVAAAVAVVVSVSWVYVLTGAGMGMSALEMTRMSQTATGAGSESSMGSEMAGGSMPGADDQMSMTAPVVWTPDYAVLMFFMWWIMMIAMMLPSATPMILLFAALNRKQRQRDQPYVPTLVFALGYLTLWAGFSVIAVALQWSLERVGSLSSTMVLTSPLLGGLLLIAAGVYQLTPIKQACLRHCRSPLHFLSTSWRRGANGAFVMGVEHGVFCVGCCWFLMLLLFFGGVMNLYWVGGLALFVLIEKVVPAGHWLSYATGLILVAGGVAFLTW